MRDIDFSHQSEDYRRIERAILFLEQNFKSRPSLDEMAKSVHLSKFHFQRVFKRWAGISAVQFMQVLTLDYAKSKLAQSQSIFDTSLDAGLSGPARLHDLFITFEAMTPGDYKKRGIGLRIEYGFHATPFGECLIAVTTRGICHLGFVAKDDRAAALTDLRRRWPEASYGARPARTQSMVRHIFSIPGLRAARPFHLLLKGTNFQINVWRALLNIPRGRIFCYQDIAAHIGRPKAVRAVASAITVNPIGYLIPCHRVIAKSGQIHSYRWGAARKRAILGWEFTRETE